MLIIYYTMLSIVSAVLLLLIIIIIILLKLIERRQMKTRQSMESLETGVPLVSKFQTNETCAQEKPLSNRIKLERLEECVVDLFRSGELERQYTLISQEQPKPWSYGVSNENKSKNRYADIIAYDHTRVVLENSKTNTQSDYINANYIDGYQVPAAYIAAQGPKISTTSDFWKMIWQNNVKFVIVLSDVYEKDKKMFDKYWPDIHQRYSYGDIQIKSRNVLEDNAHRVFDLICNTEVRTLHQYQFLSWPDDASPFNPLDLVAFLRITQKLPLNSKSPIVVHCRSGVSRTGTFLLCDICLRMAAEEGAVDLLKNLYQLRDQRPKMVNSLDQYKLAHLVIVEYLRSANIKTISEELNYLNTSTWQEQIRHCNNASSEDDLSDLNAVVVDGYKKPGRFIVTEQPSFEKFGKFWRFVVQRKISSVISLNHTENEKEKFWPSDSTTLVLPNTNITLLHHSTTSVSYCDLITIQIRSNNKKKLKTVKIIFMKNWPSNSSCPKSVEDFLLFWQYANTEFIKSRPIIVTCRDGLQASGIYVAMSFIMERIQLNVINNCKLINTYHVYQAVRTMRYSGRQFIVNEAQYVFLHKAAEAFVSSFEQYVNCKFDEHVYDEIHL